MKHFVYIAGLLFALGCASETEEVETSRFARAQDSIDYNSYNQQQAGIQTNNTAEAAQEGTLQSVGQSVKIDPLDLVIVGLKITAAKYHDYEALKIDHDLSGGAEYYEFAICPLDGNDCYPTKATPENYSNPPYEYPNNLIGQVNVYVRGCVRAAQSTTNKDGCGEWNHSIYLQAPVTDGPIYQSFFSLYESKKEMKNHTVNLKKSVKKYLDNHQGGYTLTASQKEQNFIAMLSGINALSEDFLHLVFESDMLDKMTLTHDQIMTQQSQNQGGIQLAGVAANTDKAINPGRQLALRVLYGLGAKEIYEGILANEAKQPKVELPDEGLNLLDDGVVKYTDNLGKERTLTPEMRQQFEIGQDGKLRQKADYSFSSSRNEYFINRNGQVVLFEESKFTRLGASESTYFVNREGRLEYDSDAEDPDKRTSYVDDNGRMRQLPVDADQRTFKLDPTSTDGRLTVIDDGGAKASFIDTDGVVRPLDPDVVKGNSIQIGPEVPGDQPRQFVMGPDGRIKINPALQSVPLKGIVSYMDGDGVVRALPKDFLANSGKNPLTRSPEGWKFFQLDSNGRLVPKQGVTPKYFLNKNGTLRVDSGGSLKKFNPKSYAPGTFIDPQTGKLVNSANVQTQVRQTVQAQRAAQPAQARAVPAVQADATARVYSQPALGAQGAGQAAPARQPTRIDFESPPVRQASYDGYRSQAAYGRGGAQSVAPQKAPTDWNKIIKYSVFGFAAIMFISVVFGGDDEEVNNNNNNNNNNNQGSNLALTAANASARKILEDELVQIYQSTYDLKDQRVKTQIELIEAVYDAEQKQNTDDE